MNTLWTSTVALRSSALTAAAFVLLSASCLAQESTPKPVSDGGDASVRDLASQVRELRALIEQMRTENAQSRVEMQELRHELQDTRKLLAPLAPSATDSVSTAESAAQPVSAEILSKPTPIYTQEARSLRIEGEVLLEVVLEASGSLRVLRVVRGLGHGLDDSAVKAAEQIRFKPAMRDGQPTDSTVVLHIIFQMA